METYLHVAVQHRLRLLREVLTAYLDRHRRFVVVGTTAAESDLLRLCVLRRPDVVLLEADPDEWDAMELIARLRRRHPRVRIVGFHQSLSPDRIRALHEAGLDTLVLGSAGLEAMLAALEDAGEEGRVKGPREPGSTLSPRELDVLQLLATGRTGQQAARTLGISLHTLENHKRRVFAKLGVRSQVEAAAIAARLGLARHQSESGTGSARLRALMRPKVMGLVRGRPGPTLDAVRRLLTEHRIPLRDERARLPSRAAGRNQVADAVAILVDPRPEDWHGLEDGDAGTPVVVVATGGLRHAEKADAMLRGASAIMPATQIDPRLKTVVDLVREGYLLIDDLEARTLIGRGRRGPGPPLPGWPLKLTGREQDIIASIERGHSVRQTARWLGISARTVENLQAHLFRKLGVHNRAAALATAVSLGLTDAAEGRAERPSGPDDGSARTPPGWVATSPRSALSASYGRSHALRGDRSIRP
ncbi:MAG: LuxR C-terminal-related transcriptional regulator [Carbonactinosporaceae bacterium]